MAAELRWILLAVGGLLVAGLWWWERRRPVPTEESALRVPDRFEPRIDAESSTTPPSLTAPPGEPAKPTPEPVENAEPPPRTTDAGREQRLDPQIVMIDNLPDDPEDVVLAAPPDHGLNQAPPQRPEVPVLEAAVRFATPPPRQPPAPPTAAPASAMEEDGEPQTPVLQVERRRTWSAPPIAPDPLADAVVERPKASRADPAPRHQRIVAIRLVALPDRRIDGGELKHALAAEGLEFGRYSIFHRILEVERPIYSLASLIEPGSFEPGLMASIQFPGISIFAVFPGPLPAPAAFDDLLATARRLADRLGGVLQDDTGSSLTGQRILSIREDLVHFEHLVTLSRTRQNS